MRIKAQYINCEFEGNQYWYTFRGNINISKKLKENQPVEIEYNNNAEYNTFLKLLGLWELFLKTLSDHTGDSVGSWKYSLKRRSGFGIIEYDHIIDEKVFVPNSMSWDTSTNEERSKLFKDSFSYVIENVIIDMSGFMEDYFNITGKELI
ncbi:MAG: hypothetical protein HGB12_03020 [Bacteroidetes bacterium]|nr:hypothetical protein [Bacteroidota bacterium]